jgi:general secretion pathway protein G
VGTHRIIRRTARRGFSLIELLVAIAIVLAIGGVVAVNLIPKKEEADINLTRTQIDSFSAALKLFKLDMKRFPTEDEGLAALWSRDAIEDEDEAEAWRGPYLETPVTKDTWNTEWLYVYPSEELAGMYKISSLGPDKEESEDDITSMDRMLDSEGNLDEAFDDFDTGASEDLGP